MLSNVGVRDARGSCESPGRLIAGGIISYEVIGCVALRSDNNNASVPLNLPREPTMNYLSKISAVILCSVLLGVLTFDASAAVPPVFKSDIFKVGTLVYSDEFDGAINRERWGAPTKDKQIANNKLVVSPKFKSKEEAMRVLKRDHHLGLEPIAHLNGIPQKFVCHLRFRFVKEKLTPDRPVLQIGHHMILFRHLQGGGHQIKLPAGPSFAEAGSGVKLGDWIDLVIEYRKGEIMIGVNGYRKIYKHKAVTIINEKDKLGPRFTFKGGPDSQIVFDYVRLWQCEE